MSYCGLFPVRILVGDLSYLALSGRKLLPLSLLEVLVARLVIKFILLKNEITFNLCTERIFRRGTKKVAKADSFYIRQTVNLRTQQDKETVVLGVVSEI